MKETTSAAMPPCFEKWCQRFDEAFSHKAQKKGFRHYLGGFLGESERKNLTQISNNALLSGLPPIASLVRLNSEETSEAAHPHFNRSNLGLRKS